MSEIIEKPTYKPFAPPKDDRPLMQKIHWAHVIVLPLVQILAIYGAYTTFVQRKTLVFSIIYYYYSSLGITAGHHRLWSHNSFKAKKLLEILLVIASCASVEQSIFRWVRDHRAHHRYNDTPLDPTNALKGFYHSHIGWLFYKRNKKDLGHVDTSDLKENPLIRFQHDNYPLLILIFSILLPTYVCGLGWGDWRGGFYYAAIFRLAVIHQLTFCNNSIAHMFGKPNYGDTQSARDSGLVAIFTLGEGFHNFHHEFPEDYGCPNYFNQYDITKFFIDAMAFLGLAYDLNTSPRAEIE
ncbi:hypothetical protein BB560_005241, partial [Smittium megazygosporum]